MFSTTFPVGLAFIQGRADLMARFKGYCENIELQSADKLITHKADSDRVVVIEYEVHGDGSKPHNRPHSISETAHEAGAPPRTCDRE